MTFGGKGFWSAMGALGQSTVDQIVKDAHEAGINFIDTADVYSEGESEQLLGQALKNTGIARKDVVVATKAYGIVGPGVNDRGSSARASVRCDRR
jgi:aryl-alcohol dehydrogenase-like predicted oxidoreductase